MIRVLLACSILAVGCGSSTNNGGGGSDLAAGGGGDGGNPGGDGGGGGPTPHFACPTDNGKPQQAWGGVLPSLGGTLDKDTTWTPDNVYLIFGSFSTGPHTLTVMPGTVICFDDDRVIQVMPPPGSLEISAGGSLKMLGTAASHVTLTDLNSGGSYWLGLHFSPGFTAGTLQNVDIYDAGGGSAIASTSPGATGVGGDPAIELTNVNLYFLLNKGVEIKGPNGWTGSLAIHSYASTATDPSYQYPAATIHPLFAKNLTSTLLTVDAAVPARSRVILLGEKIITSAVRLPDIGIPYRTDTDGIWLNGPNHGDDPSPMPAVLTVDPGVTVQVSNMIYVGHHQDGGGDLVAAGTAAKPILFTSAAITPTEGWSGIFFEMREANVATSKLDHVTLENSGAPGLETVFNCQDMTGSAIGGMVNFNGPPNSMPYAGIPITNSTFRMPQPHTDGIRYNCQSATGSCLTTDYTLGAKGNTFTGFAMPCAKTDATSSCGMRPLACM